MRIAYVVGHYPSVSETFIAAQIRELERRGHTVDVYADRGAAGAGAAVARDDRPVHRPVRIGAALATGSYGFAVKALGSCAGALAVPAWYRGVTKYGIEAMVTAGRYAAAQGWRPAGYDVVHAHFGPNGIKAAAMRQLGILGGPLAVAFHGYDLSLQLQRFGQGYYTQLFAETGLCLPVTERWRDRLIELGCAPERIVVQRMGVDCAEFSFAQRSRRSGRPAELLTVARLVEKKGVPDALHALALLPPELDYRYTIIGDGPERQRVEMLVATLGLQQRVTLLGPREQEEVRRQLYRTDVLLLPSHTAANGDEEGLPVSIMEAMATGLPVVSTVHSGIPSLVSDGVEGFLVAERDVRALAQRIATLISNEDLCARMGSAARRRVEQQHDHQRLVTGLESLFYSLSSGAASRAQKDRERAGAAV